MPDNDLPQSSMILYQAEDGRTRIQCRFENETLWLTQALIAELFEIGVNTVNYHLKEFYDDGELQREATIRQYRIVRFEGSREVNREIEHYSLPAILAVGYRVRSQCGTQFRQWATARLSEYLVILAKQNAILWFCERDATGLPRGGSRLLLHKAIPRKAFSPVSSAAAKSPRTKRGRAGWGLCV